MSRKVPVRQELDEEYLRSLMAAPASEPRVRRSDAEDYASRFLKNTPSEARQCVYIDRRLHRKITTLVGVAGNRRFTVGNFIDNVLEQHFERHRTEIRSLCSKGLNKIL